MWFRPDPGSGPFARDFEAYYAAGSVWNAGGDPYSRGVWQVERTVPGVDATHDEMLPYVGPAAALPFWSLVARLPFRPARLLWEIVLACAVAAIVAGSLALAGAPPSPARGTIALILGGTCGPVISGFTLGQAALVGAAGTILAFLALERRSRWAIPAAFVAAIQPNLALPLATRAFDRRSFVMLAIAAAAFIGVTLVAGGGIAGLIAYANVLRLHDGAERFITIQHTLPALIAALGAPHALADVIAAAASLIALVAIVAVGVRRRTQPLIGACVGVALLPLVVPFFHEHDFAIDLLPAIVLLVRGDARTRILAGCASVMTLIDWFGLAQRPQATVQIAALATAVAVAVAILAGRDGATAAPERWATLAPLVTAAALAAVCIPLAHAYVAPTWPETLGTYRAPPGVDISSIWGEEGVRSGLTAIAPAWSILRAIPLLGCVLLALASARLGRAGYATTTAPSRTTIGMPVNESPLHGPAVHNPSSIPNRAEW